MKREGKNILVISFVIILSCLFMLSAAYCPTNSLIENCAYLDVSGQSCISCYWPYTLSGNVCVDQTIQYCASYDARWMCTQCQPGTQLYKNRCINGSEFQYGINEKVCFSSLKCSWRSNLRLKSTYNWTTIIPNKPSESWTYDHYNDGSLFTETINVVMYQQPNGLISGTMQNGDVVNGSFSYDGLKVNMHFKFQGTLDIYLEGDYDPVTQIITGYWGFILGQHLSTITIYKPTQTP